MILQGRNLSIGVQGEDVMQLHNELRLLSMEIPDDELLEAFFGKGTHRAIMQFQEIYGLDITGEVDDLTVERINAEVAALQPERVEFFVSGHVWNADRIPLSGLIVRAYDRNFRREDVLLGEAVTSLEGIFQIPYSLEQLRQFEKSNADLFVSVFNAHEQLLDTSRIRYAANPVETIDFVLNQEEYRGSSEYERLMTDLRPFLQDDLTEDEIEYVVGRMGVNRQHIQWLVQALKLAQETDRISDSGIPAEAFYGWFRLDLLPLSANLSALSDLSIDTLLTTLKMANEQQIVPSDIGEGLDKISACLEQIKLDSVLQAPVLGTAASLRDLLDTLPEPLNPLQQHAIAATVADLRPEDPNLVDRIRSIPGLEGDATKVARTLRLGALTNGDVPLMQALQSRFQNGATTEDEETLRPLAALRPDEWINLAIVHGSLEGTTITPVARAEALAAHVERLHPTATLAAHLTGGRRLANQPVLADVGTFLQENPHFDIVTANLNTLSSEAEPGSVEETQHHHMIEGLRVLQHMHVLGASWEESATLLENDLSAPHDLLAAGPTQLTTLLDGQLTPERVTALYQQAEDLHDLTLALFTAAFSPLNAPNVLPGLIIPGGGDPVNPDDLGGSHPIDPRITAMRDAVSGTMGIVPRLAPVGAVSAQVFPNESPLTYESKQAIAHEPTLQVLFGAQEACACGHCQSVLSPAAYFIDVLEFINKAGLRDRLLTRRPDLQDVELSCNNTNTEVPAIDLALEILENAVAFAVPLEVDLPIGMDILQELNGIKDSSKIREALGKTVRKLSDDLWAKQEGADSDWTVIDGHRRWKLSVQPHGALMADTRILDIGRLDLATLIAEMDHNKQASAGAKPVFAKLFTGDNPLLDNTEYEVKVAPLKRGQSWRIRFQFVVHVLTSFAPVPKLVLQTPGGIVWWAEEYKEATIQSINDELSAEGIPELVRVLLRDRFNSKASYTVVSTGIDTWTIKSNIEERTLRFVPASLKVTSLTYQSGDPKADAVAEPENHNPEAYKMLKGQTFPWSLPIDLPLEEVRLYLERALSSRRRLIELMMPLDQNVRENNLFAREVLGLSEAEADVITLSSAPKIYEHWGISSNATSIVDTTAGRIVTGASPLILLKNVSILLQQSRLTFEELQGLIETQFVSPNSTAYLPIEPLGSCKPSEMTLITLTPGHLDRMHRFVRLQRRLGWSTLELDTAIKITTDTALNANTLLQLANLVRLSELLDLPISVILAWWSDPLVTTSRIHRLARALGTTKAELDDAQILLFGNTNPFTSPGDALEFCEKVMRFQRSSITFEDARYLLMHHETPGSNVTLDDKQLAQLEEAVHNALQATLDAPEKISSLAADDPENVAIDIAIHRAREDTIITTLATSLGAERELVNNLLRIQLRHPSNPKKPAIDVFLSSVGAFIDLWGLVGKLVTHSDPVSLYLWERFSVKNQEALADHRLTALQQQSILAFSLNRVMGGTSIFERSRFAHVKLSGETLSLIQQNPTEKAPLLNRMLLDDAYPLEIEKHQNRDYSLNKGEISQPRSVLVKSVLLQLYKAVFICDALKLNSPALTLLQTAITDKNGFIVLDFNTLPVDTSAVRQQATVEDFARLLALAQLCSMPGAANLLRQASALDFTTVDSMDAVHTLLATGFALDKNEVKAAAAQLHITTAEQHRDPIKLARLIELLAALKKLGATVDETRNSTDDPGHPNPVLPSTPNGLIAPSPTDADATNARTLLRSKYGESNWHELIKPIADKLRERQRNALMDYMIATDQMRVGNPDMYPDTYYRLRSTDDLYERYLIDVQTGSCLKTTRLLQATAAAQLFVQRVILNLEKNASLSPDKRKLWEWIHSYRVWEANRKVFLFPENWLLPELRDDKTAIFRQMESALGEQEPSPENTRSALLGYLEDLGDLAQISVIAMYEDHQNIGTKETPVWKETLYVVGRTPNDPYRYFWRSCAAFGTEKMSWSGWEALDLDNANDFIMPFVLEGDLHIAWPIFRKKVDDKNEDNLLWEVQIAWMRRTTHGWVKRKVGKTPLGNVTRLPNKDEAQSFAFQFTKDVSPVLIPGSTLALSQEKITINCYTANEVNPNIGITVDPALTNANPKHMPILSNLTLTKLSVSGIAYEWATVDQANKIKKKMPVVGMSVLVSWQHNGAAFAGPVQYGCVVSTDQNGAFTVPIKYPGTDGTHDGYVLNGGDVTLTFLWPSGPPILVSASLVDNGKYYDSWDWRFSVGKENKRIADEYLSDRPVVYKPAGSFTIEAGKDLRLGTTPPAFKQLAGFSVDGNRFSTANDVHSTSYAWISLDADGDWWGPTPLKLPLVITRATQPQAPGRPTPTRIWYLQEKDSGFFLQKQADSWCVWPDGQPFASSYCTYAALSTSALFHPAIQKYLHNYDAANKFERYAAYANYNWELFLHVPLAIVDYLASQQRFEEARRWLHVIFDPTTDEKVMNVPQFWRFLPFIKDSQPDSIAQMLTWLAKTTDLNFEETPEFKAFEEKFASQIEDWKQNPFMPHLIARLRPSAYQWHTFFAYLDVLIGWGDQLFRRDTRESVNEATLLYILAAKLLGPRPRIIPASTPPVPQTYRSLPKDDNGYLDGFSNAWVKYADLSGLKKLLNQSQQGRAKTLSGLDGVTFVQPPDYDPKLKKDSTSHLDSLSALAFCIPQNERVTEFYDRVEDRLFNVRNCRNIDGVFRELPLYEPPIDPLLLIRARAAGLDINDVLDDLYAPLPNYRFSFTLQKALELCAELKSLGGALLAALEKKDSEELTLLRSSHEIAMLILVSEIRKQQIAEAEANITVLEQSKETILERFGQYQKLLGKPGVTKGQDGLPVVEQSSSLAVTTDSGGGVSGLGLSRTEIAQLNWMATANTYTQAANSVHLLTAIAAMLPNVWIGAITAGQTWGGANLWGILTAGAKAVEMGAVNANYLATLMGTFAGFERRQDEWVHQSKQALGELKQLDKQLIAAQIRREIAQRELDNHDTQIENARTVDLFMRGKFTNQQLYRWMSSQISEVYFRTYQLALDQARRAERAYQYELGLDKPSSFIQAGSWDTLKKGLLAGDHLHHALKRMESTYLERNVREFEITKHISLLQLDPMALIRLRETGSCEFNLPEVLFDLDFPTHYLRRIKSVSLSIPCVTGPYASVSATLELKSSKTRYKSSPADLPKNYKSLSTIVTSSGQMDSGMFETNLRDERYLPFEGAGAIGDWELSLPKEFHQFDYSTISDVVLHMRYTAKEGSTDRTDQIRPSLNALSSQSQTTGLAQLFSLRYHFPTQWHQLQSGTVHKAYFTILPLHFPLLLKGKKITVSNLQFEMILKEPKESVLSMSLEQPHVASIEWKPSNLTLAPTQYFTGNCDPSVPKVVLDLANEQSKLGLKLLLNAATANSAQIEDLQDMLVIVYYTINSP